MKTMDGSAYRELLAATRVIERDRHGEKVLQQPDGNFTKIFRRKRWLSTALLRPYALRFGENAKTLAFLAVPTVAVVDICHCREMNRHLVTYRPLPGETLRSMLHDFPDERQELLMELAGFIALLHLKGVYFRSLHFGNIIVMPERQGLGLIDVADMTIKGSSLRVAERLRNFRHMLRYAEDVGFLREYGWERFVDSYLAATQLAAGRQKCLRNELVRFPEFASGLSNE